MEAETTKEKGKRSRPRPSLTATLEHYCKHEVIPRQSDKECTQLRVIKRVIQPILQTIGEIDDRFRNVGLCQTQSPDRISSPQQSTTLRHASTGARPRNIGTSTHFDAQSIPPINRFIGINKNSFHDFDYLVAMDNFFVDCVPNCLPGYCNDRSRPSLKSSTQRNLTVTFIDSTCCNNPYTPVLNGFGYLAVDIRHTLVHDLISDLKDSVDNIGRGMEEEAYLSPHQFLQKFYELISEAVRELDEKCYWEREPTVYEVDVRKQESGVTLKIILAGETFTVDLLPSLLLHTWPESMKTWHKAHPNNKWLSSDRTRMITEDLYLICDSKARTDDERLWKVCYEKSANTLLEYADLNQVDSCRYTAYSILETLIEDNAADFAPMTPQLFRNIFIDECIRYPHDEDWYHDKLGRAFIDLFERIIECVKTSNCVDVFTQSNLVKSGRKREMKQISLHLKAILHDIVKQPRKSAFLAINY